MTDEMVLEVTAELAEEQADELEVKLAQWRFLVEADDEAHRTKGVCLTVAGRALLEASIGIGELELELLRTKARVFREAFNVATERPRVRH